MLKHDLGYYVGSLLRREEDMSLFPEFYKLFHHYGVSNTLASLRFHPDYKKAISAIAFVYGSDPEELDEAVESVLDVIIEAEKGHHFALVLDFIDIFGGTRIDVPSRKDFDKLVFAAEIYSRVINSDDPESEVLAIAGEGTMAPSALRKLVNHVHQLIGDNNETPLWREKEKED